MLVKLALAIEQNRYELIIDAHSHVSISVESKNRIKSSRLLLNRKCIKVHAFCLNYFFFRKFTFNQHKDRSNVIFLLGFILAT